MTQICTAHYFYAWERYVGIRLLYRPRSGSWLVDQTLHKVSSELYLLLSFNLPVLYVDVGLPVERNCRCQIWLRRIRCPRSIQTAVYFTLNIPDLRSDFPRLHTEILCLHRQSLAFAVTFLSCTVNFLAFTDNSSPSHV